MPELSTPTESARPALSPVSGMSRRDAVIAEIKRGVALGRIQPGQKLTEQSLSSALRVSRPTIREALNQLVMEGLLTQEPYRGMRVADLEPQMVLDIANVRMAIDLQAVTAILADSTGRRQRLLEEAWTHYAGFAGESDPLVQHEAHVVFHRALWEASENQFLTHLWPVVEAHITIALAHDQATRQNPDRAYDVHQELVDAVKSGDQDRLQRAFAKHTLDSAHALVDIVSSPGDGG